MNIDQELRNHTPGRETVLTIGVFDGVHRGHRHLMSALVAEADRVGLLSGVVTFGNHPASVLRRDFKSAYLTSVDDRMRLINELGIALVVPLTFDLELSMVSARQFVSLLTSRLKMRGMVVGPDFAMGHNREGDVRTLSALGNELGFSVRVVEPLTDSDGRVIRSTAVRNALGRGDVTLVADLQGRNFVLDGTVVKGRGRGRPMGFPTANLEVRRGMAVPGDGTYATWAHVATKRYMAATNIGVRPTFNEAGRTIEAFLLDFDGDLYGRQVRLEFVRRLRDEVRFDSVRALQEQVDRDVHQTRAMLEAGRAGVGSGS